MTDKNTGNGNTGHWNTGNCNTGNGNTGHWNTGHWNTGDRNTGHWNTGNWNTGDRNTGHWNTGNWNTGSCNSVTPEDILVFNKPCTRTAWDEAIKPGWMYVNLTQWVSEKNMTDKERVAYPSYVTTGGYLKTYPSLKAAYVDAWENATQDDRDLTRQLPNFDPEVFEEVFGFNPFKKKTRRLELDLTDEQYEQVKRVLDGGND